MTFKKLTIAILSTFILTIAYQVLAAWSTGPYGNYPNPGHYPGQIGPGTFNCSGETNCYWSFPNALFINSNSGKLGIGTTTPSTKLDVNGSAKIRGDLDMGGNKITNVNQINANNVSANEICLSGDCQSSWPSGGGGLRVAHLSNDFYDIDGKTIDEINTEIASREPGYHWCTETEINDISTKTTLPIVDSFISELSTTTDKVEIKYYCWGKFGTNDDSCSMILVAEHTTTWDKNDFGAIPVDSSHSSFRYYYYVYKPVDGSFQYIPKYKFRSCPPGYSLGERHPSWWCTWNGDKCGYGATYERYLSLSGPDLKCWIMRTCDDCSMNNCDCNSSEIYVDNAWITGGSNTCGDDKRGIDGLEACADNINHRGCTHAYDYKTWKWRGAKWCNYVFPDTGTTNALNNTEPIRLVLCPD